MRNYEVLQLKKKAIVWEKALSIKKKKAGECKTKRKLSLPELFTFKAENVVVETSA